MRDAPPVPLRLTVLLVILGLPALVAGEQGAFPHLSRAVETSEPAVVLVRTLADGPGGHPRVVARNTGFFVDDSGTVVTSVHVWVPDGRLQVLRHGGKRADARLAAVDQHAGLALLKTDLRNTLSLRPAPSAPQEGRWVVGAVAHAHPQDGFHVLYRPGKLSSTGHARRICGVKWKNLVTIDLPVVRGAAASPVLDKDGRIVALVMAAEKSKNGRRRTLALPAKPYKASLEVMRSGGRRMGWLGVALTCDEKRSGARVEDVLPGSPADKVGLQAGDVLLRVGGKKVTCAAVMEKRVVKARPGTTVEVAIRRNNRERKLDVKIGSRPLHIGP